MVMVMGLWNLRLRGSKVTMGLKEALFPRVFLTTSTLTGWACQSREDWKFVKYLKRASFVPSRFHTQSLHTQYCLYNNFCYLQPNPDPLGEGPFRKHSLHLGHHGAAQDATFRTNQIAVLLNARHHSKVLWEISRDDPANALPLELLWGVQV